MKTCRSASIKICAALWLMSTALFATGSAVQFSQPNWPALQRENAVATKFDEYSNIRFNDEKARLDSFVIQLQNDPRSQGYIIGYGGRICRPNEAKARARRAASYLIHTRGIDGSRLVTIDGGYRSDVGAELYLVPLGASLPSAAPSISKCTKETSTTKARSRRKR